MEQFKRQAGIQGVLLQGITGPAPVMEALKEVQLNNMLIGSSATHEAIEKRDFLEEITRRDPGHPQGDRKQPATLLVPGQRNGAPWQRYMANVSKYSGHANLQMRDVGPATWASMGSPEDKIKEIENRLQQQKNVMEEIGDQARESDAEFAKADKQYVPKPASEAFEHPQPPPT